MFRRSPRSFNWSTHESRIFFDASLFAMNQPTVAPVAAKWLEEQEKKGAIKKERVKTNGHHKPRTKR